MLAEPNCHKRSCKHYRGVKGTCTQQPEFNICDAFPNGIHVEIAYGDNDHTNPYPGDHGIMYEHGEMPEWGMQSVPLKKAVFIKKAKEDSIEELERQFIERLKEEGMLEE